MLFSPLHTPHSAPYYTLSPPTVGNFHPHSPLKVRLLLLCITPHHFLCAASPPLHLPPIILSARYYSSAVFRFGNSHLHSTLNLRSLLQLRIIPLYTCSHFHFMRPSDQDTICFNKTKFIDWGLRSPSREMLKGSRISSSAGHACFNSYLATAFKKALCHTPSWWGDGQIPDLC